MLDCIVDALTENGGHKCTAWTLLPLLRAGWLFAGLIPPLTAFTVSFCAGRSLICALSLAFVVYMLCSVWLLVLEFFDNSFSTSVGQHRFSGWLRATALALPLTCGLSGAFFLSAICELRVRYFLWFFTICISISSLCRHTVDSVNSKCGWGGCPVLLALLVVLLSNCGLSLLEFNEPLLCSPPCWIGLNMRSISTGTWSIWCGNNLNSLGTKVGCTLLKKRFKFST